VLASSSCGFPTASAGMSIFFGLGPNRCIENAIGSPDGDALKAKNN
jgi:hypothetical protein